MELSGFFENPKILLLVLFFLPFFIWKGQRRRKRVVVSSLVLYKIRSIFRNICVNSPYWLLVLILMISIAGLAGPYYWDLQPVSFQLGYRNGLCFDDSGSMKGDKIEAAKKAGAAFVLKRPNDVFSFIPFGSTALFAGGIRFTSDRALIIDAISQLNADAGATAIGDGYLAELVFLINDVIPIDPETGKKEFEVEFERLKKSLEVGPGSEEYVYKEMIYKRMGRIEGAFVTCISDAENNSGIEPEIVLEYMARFGVPAFIISVGTEQSRTFIKALERTGGGYFFAGSEKETGIMMDKIDNLNPVRIKRGFESVRHSYRPFLAWFLASLFGAAVLLWAMGLKMR